MSKNVFYILYRVKTFAIARSCVAALQDALALLELLLATAAMAFLYNLFKTPAKRPNVGRVARR